MPGCDNEVDMSADKNASEDLSLDETVGAIPKPDAYTFMVKIWVEEIEEGTGRVLWRGYVKNVFEKDTVQHFQDLDGLMSSIFPYLKKLGIEEGEQHSGTTRDVSP
jgi:hypothetical protein